MHRASGCLGSADLFRCALAGLSLLCSGCVDRKLTIRSEPTECVATLDGRPVGSTPATVRFTQYGGREVTLSKTGYYRHREIVRVEPPVYQWFGLDLFFELVWPFTIVDEQVFTFTLRPIAGADSDKPIDTSALEQRARKLQERAEQYGSSGD